MQNTKSTGRKELRGYVAGFAHETNSFSPMPTSLRNFEVGLYYHPGDTVGLTKALHFPGYGDAVATARAAGDVVVEGPCFWAQPSGPMTRHTYEHLRDELLSDISSIGPVDYVILNLHGAMMSEGLDDCEGDILQRVRARLGPDVPVGALLDLHCNATPAMIASGAILISNKEYPHSDYPERAIELHHILSLMANTGIKPSTRLRQLPILSVQGTTEEPMRSFVALLARSETLPGIFSVSLLHGFPWSDGEHTGASILVVHHGAYTETVEKLVDDLTERISQIVSNAPVKLLGTAHAVTEAIQAARGTGPIILADSSDNPGGGAACDSTYLLQELLSRRVQNAAIGMIWDPQAAAIAADAGVSAKLSLRVGGKVSPRSGQPLDLDVTVKSIRTDAMQRKFGGKPTEQLGLTVALRVEGLDIVLNSIRQQVFSPECFTELGIDVVDKNIVAIKSSQHFRTCFDPIMRRAIYCNAPGSLTTSLNEFDYNHLKIIKDGSHFRSTRPVKDFQCCAN